METMARQREYGDGRDDNAQWPRSKLMLCDAEGRRKEGRRGMDTANTDILASSYILTPSLPFLFSPFVLPFTLPVSFTPGLLIMFGPSPRCFASNINISNKPTPTLCNKRRHSASSSASSLPSLSPSSSPILFPSHSAPLPRASRPPQDPAQQLLPVILSGVQQVSFLDIHSGPLASRHITSILHGDCAVLSTGEAALSRVRRLAATSLTPQIGGRPRSATRAVASNPAQYGAPASLRSAMALAHAHCTLYDLFALDARLAPDSAYQDILAPFVTALTDWPAVVTTQHVTPEPDTSIFKLLDLPRLALGSGASLGLRCDAVELTFPGSSTPYKGISLIPRLVVANVVWNTSRRECCSVSSYGRTR